jgi:D-sedoheptulose 7-phosphate isomerase
VSTVRAGETAERDRSDRGRPGGRRSAAGVATCVPPVAARLDLPTPIDFNAPALAGSRAAIRRAFAASIAAKRTFLREHAADLAAVAALLAERFAAGSKLLLFGNGGSAADAQHLAAELVNRFVIERPPLAAIALTTDTSALTSIANDYRYDEVFAKQVRALGRPGDVALAISTSGSSPNVVRAVAACKRLGIHTVGLTGGNGGRLRGMVDHLLNVSATRETARVQETHILAGHVLCELVDAELHGGRGRR